MKKRILIIAMIVAVAVCSIFLRDGLTYIITSIMALIIISVARKNKSRIMKVTRWAKINPKKSQVFITIVQILLMATGLILGYNLKKLGFEFSDTTGYLFSSLMIIGLLSVPFLPKRKTIAIPKTVQKHRLAYLSMVLAIFTLMAFAGNRTETLLPNSPLTHTLEKIDQFMFQDDSSQTIGINQSPSKQIQDENNNQFLTNHSNAKSIFTSQTIGDKKNESKAIYAVYVKPNSGVKGQSKSKKKTERKAKRKAKKQLKKWMKKNRKKIKRAAASAGLCALGIVLIILLLVPLCAGICLALGIFGASVATVIGGIALTAGSIWAMIKAGQMCINYDD